MDPMTEIFYEESNSVISEIRRSMRSWEDGEASHDAESEQDMVMEIFRGVHTLKADSAMMLYENMSELSRRYEGLLYCFRGEGKTIEDLPRFISILDAYIAFFEQETDKLVQDKKPDGNASSLLKKIEKYVEDMKKKMAKEEIALYDSRMTSAKPKRQVFYIASAKEGTEDGDVSGNPDDGIVQMEYPDTQSTEFLEGLNAQTSPAEDKKAEKEDAGQSIFEHDSYGEEPSLEEVKKHYRIDEPDKEGIFKSVRFLQRLISKIEYTQDSHGNGMITREQFERLEEIYEELGKVKKKLDKTDFVPVAGKLETLVDEMCMKLHKNARILFQGVHTTVDHEMREKISSALTHMIRNSMDHGIESLDERERYGKAPVGLIKVRFSMEDNHLKVVVKDDGRGLEKDKIIAEAVDKKILDKPVSEYTEEEIYNLIFYSGLSTTKKVNDYSGRGVGMDVVAHNIKELGGKIKVRSTEGEGTTMTIKI